MRFPSPGQISYHQKPFIKIQLNETSFILYYLFASYTSWINRKWYSNQHVCMCIIMVLLVVYCELIRVVFQYYKTFYDLIVKEEDEMNLFRHIK